VLSKSSLKAAKTGGALWDLLPAFGNVLLGAPQVAGAAEGQM